MSESFVQYVLGCYSASPVCMWGQMFLIPNCQTKPIWWEADLLAVSRAGYCTEVEIKCTLSDWRADQHKAKHRGDNYTGARETPIIKKFYYAGPMKLMERFGEVWTREGSGIIGVEHREGGWSPIVRVLREPTADRRARKLTEQELILFGRTANIRYWNWAHSRREPTQLDLTPQVHP